MNDGAFHLHQVSDSSGETVTSVTRACLVQYENINVTKHSWWLIRTPGQMTRVIEGIRANPGLVIFTLLESRIRKPLEQACREIGVPHLSVLDPIMQALAAYFNRRAGAEIGRQHALDEGYFERIDAMHFALQHDDGQSLETIGAADMVLMGVSRTSKTPTCMYLANRGFKVGNIPLVPGIHVSEDVFKAPRPLFVGLTREAKSLTDIRQSRLRIMNEDREVGYATVESVREEVTQARRLFTKHNWPVIDVTRRSIEETAATVIQLFNDHIATKPTDRS